MPTRLRRTRTEREAVLRPGKLKQQAEWFRRLLADRVKEDSVDDFPELPDFLPELPPST